jgi:hypothetical protein
MSHAWKFFLAVILFVAGLALFVPGFNTPTFSTAQGSSQHYVVVNNNDANGVSTGTVLKLAGTARNPTLKTVTTLNGGEQESYQLPFPSVQAVAHGGDVCGFLADRFEDTPAENAIDSFKYPGLTKVGSYSNNAVANSQLGIAGAATNGCDYEFADWFTPDGYWECNNTENNCTWGSGTAYPLEDFFNVNGFSSTNAFTEITGAKYMPSCFINPTGTGCFGVDFEPSDPDNDVIDE